MLVVAFDNIAQVGTPVDAAFVYYDLVDAHTCLMDPYNMCDAYPGYCLAMSIIQVPLSLCPAAATLDTCNSLWQKAHPSLLTINGQQAKLMLMGIRTAAS